MPLLEIISKNRKLKTVDLSGNDLLVKTKVRDAPRYQSILEQIERDKKLASPYKKSKTPSALTPKKTPTTAKGDSDDEMDDELLAATYITNFIKYNKQLMHFDLSNTSLTLKMFNKISSVWTNIMALNSFHLSNNPFIDQITDWPDLMDRLKAKPKLSYSELPDFPELREIVKPDGSHEMLFMKHMQLRLR